MHDDADAATRCAMQAILAYLERWPQAADSQRGIGQWWLPAMGADVPPADLALALERLVAQHRLQRTQLPDGSCIYRAAAGRAGQQEPKAGIDG